MKLYLIKQNVNNDYDTYDSAVVCAESEEQAKQTHPSGNGTITHYERDHARSSEYSDWTTNPDEIKVTLIGIAHETQSIGVICASFNAG